MLSIKRWMVSALWLSTACFGLLSIPVNACSAGQYYSSIRTERIGCAVLVYRDICYDGVSGSYLAYAFRLSKCE